MFNASLVGNAFGRIYLFALRYQRVRGGRCEVQKGLIYQAWESTAQRTQMLLKHAKACSFKIRSLIKVFFGQWVDIFSKGGWIEYPTYVESQVKFIKIHKQHLTCYPFAIHFPIPYPKKSPAFVLRWSWCDGEAGMAGGSLWGDRDALQRGDDWMGSDGCGDGDWFPKRKNRKSHNIF